MAKGKSRFKNSGAYVAAAILVAVMYIVNAILVDRIYWNNSNVSQTTSRVMNSLNKINGQLSEINNDTIAIAANLKTDMEAITKDTAARYGNIIDAEHAFEATEGLSDEAMRRYN